MRLSHTMKWILAIGLALIAGAGMVGMSMAWREVRATAENVRFLQQEGTALAEALAKAQAARKDMAEWTRLRTAARQAGLIPEQWLLYPVSLTQDLTMDGLNQMMALASQGRPRGGTYWFLPQSFSFSRSQAPASDAAVETGKAKLYHGQMQGMFMTRKPDPKTLSTP